MSPRGFYQKESVHPHFTSNTYINSEAHKKELESLSNLLLKWTLFKLSIRQWFGI
jgi:hypothetical protein